MRSDIWRIGIRQFARFRLWLQSTSIWGLTAPWIVLLHWLLLSVARSTLSKSRSVKWMILPNHVVFGYLFSFFLIRFLGWYHFLNNGVSWCDQNTVISLSLHLLTKFFLLQLFQNPLTGFSCCPRHPHDVLTTSFQINLNLFNYLL